MRQERELYDDQFIVKAPRSFTDALDHAARMHLMSKSDYVRSTLAARMKVEGIDLNALPGAA